MDVDYETTELIDLLNRAAIRAENVWSCYLSGQPVAVHHLRLADLALENRPMSPAQSIFAQLADRAARAHHDPDED